MTTVVEMDVEYKSRFLDSGDCDQGRKLEALSKEKENEKNVKGCLSDVDGARMTTEVKIDISATSLIEEKDKSCMKKATLLPTHVTQDSPPVDFSEDAPEVSTRVYDFNMVKQKTLPRISFGANRVFDAFSSHSKSYIIVWTLTLISLVICIVILILYFLP